MGSEMCIRDRNKQLKKYHVSIKQGALVDASVVETPFTPKGPLIIEVAEDREDTRSEEELISPIRSTIERTFGSIKRWFHGGRCRYRGLAKAHTQNVLEGMAFNLYRTPGLIMSRGLI